MQELEILMGAYWYKGASCCMLRLNKDALGGIHLINDYGEFMFVVNSARELAEKITELLEGKYAE